MKKVHGKALQDISLMNTVLIDKKYVTKRHLLLTLGFPPNSDIAFQPGDLIKIFTENDHQLVQKVMNRLSEKPENDQIVAWEGESHFLKCLSALFSGSYNA